MTPASNFRSLMRRTRHLFTWANFERRSTKIRTRSPRSSDDGVSWSPPRVMSWPLGPHRRDSLGQYSPQQHGTGPGLPLDAEVQVAQYKDRGYSISISIKRFDDKVKVETEIFLPPDVDDRDGYRSLAGNASESVSVLALEDIHKEAFESAKRTVDVLIAERSALCKVSR